jgi:hypothetical protein
VGDLNFDHTDTIEVDFPDPVRNQQRHVLPAATAADAYPQAPRARALETPCAEPRYLCLRWC